MTFIHNHMKESGLKEIVVIENYQWLPQSRAWHLVTVPVVKCWQMMDI